MRVARAAVLCSLLPALAACGGSGDGDGDGPAPLPAVTTVPAPAATTSAGAFDDAGLRAALLSAQDLPVGFTALPDPVADLGLPPASEDSPSDLSSTDPAVCAGVLAPIADQAPGAAARAVARYSGPDFTSVDTDAASYGSTAADVFTAVQDTLAACTAFAGTDADGVAVNHRLGGLDQPGVGDASVAVRLETVSEGFTMVSDTVIAVVGGTLVQVTATGQEPIDAAVLADLAHTAVDNLRSDAS